MAYINASDVLPPELVAAIQQHIDGKLLYIPRQTTRRQAWGTCSGSRELLWRRNAQIHQAYQTGCRIDDLAERFHLSEDSIRKIVSLKSRQIAR